MSVSVRRQVNNVVVSLVFAVGSIEKPKYKTMSVGKLHILNYFPDLPSIDDNDVEMGLIWDVCDALNGLTSYGMVDAREVITSSYNVTAN